MSEKHYQGELSEPHKNTTGNLKARAIILAVMAGVGAAAWHYGIEPNLKAPVAPASGPSQAGH